MRDTSLKDKPLLLIAIECKTVLAGTEGFVPLTTSSCAANSTHEGDKDKAGELHSGVEIFENDETGRVSPGLSKLNVWYTV